MAQDGSWNYTFATLGEGEHSYTITATDAFGITNSSTVHFSVDLTPPDAPTVDVDALGNSGTPAFSGTAEAGSKVIITINGQVYPSIMDSQGNWQVDWSQATPLGEGNHQYSVVVEDGAGNQSTAATGNFNIDLTPPDVPFVDVDAHTNSVTPDFSCGTEATGRVIITINGQVYPTILNEQGDWQIDWSQASPLGEGVHTYSVIAIDAAGNPSEANTGSFNVDLTPPDAPLVDVDAQGTTATPDFTGTVEIGGDVLITINGQAYPSIIDAQGNWQIDWSIATPLGEGMHNYSVVVTDAAGNPSPATTGSFNLTLSPAPVQETEPQAEAVLLLDESENSAQQTKANTTPTFAGSVAAGTSVLLLINERSYQTIADENERWTITLPAQDALSEGEHMYSILLSDDEGNESLTHYTFNTQQESLKHTFSESEEASNFMHFEGVSVPEATIRLEIDGKDYQAQADEFGAWEITSHIRTDDATAHSYTLTAELDGEIISQQSNDTEQAPVLSDNWDETQNENDDFTFEGDLPNNAVSVEFVFNDESIEVSYADNAPVWTATVPAEQIATLNHYQVKAIDAEGNSTIIVDEELVHAQHNHTATNYVTDMIDVMPEIQFNDEANHEDY